jgi:hypothetical protein
MIFFSKYDIFNEYEIYDEEVYNDHLTEEQFKETLIWYKENLERIYCFKYSSNYLPKCLLNDLNKIKDENKENNLFNRYSMRDIFIYKKENDNCDILDYSYKNYNKK